MAASSAQNNHHPALYINDTQLDNAQSINHLGHILNYDLSDDKDVANQKKTRNNYRIKPIF